MNRAILVLVVVAVATAVVFMLLFNVLSARYERAADSEPAEQIVPAEVTRAADAQPLPEAGAAGAALSEPGAIEEIDDMPPAVASGGVLDG